jgi:peptide/nickel transport system substrate-binding protein
VDVRSVAAVVAVDESTVKVSLSAPDAQFRYYSVATTAGHVIPKPSTKSTRPISASPPRGLVGTGPYKFVSWAAGSEVVLERNPDYWDADAASDVKKAVFKIIPEDATRVAASRPARSTRR